MNKAYTYENVQIGNFLISIGYYLRDLNKPIVRSVNLLQQTPGDYEVGDVFGALAGKYFILEFKPDKNKIKDELKKKQRIELIAQVAINPAYERISQKGLLIGFPFITENYQLEYNFEPYFAVINTKSKTTSPKIKSSRDFVIKLLQEDQDFGCDLDEISTYIKLLNKCADNEGDSSISGIVVCVNKEEGLSSYTFDNIHELALAMNINLGISQTKEIKRTHERSKSKGRGFSM